HWPGGVFLALAGVVLIALRDAIQLFSGEVKGFTAWTYFIGRICLFAYIIVPRLVNTEMNRFLLIPAGIAFGVGIVYSTFLQKKP
ncbi:MAG: hypothetical protein ACPGED_09465, partial [Flavobacteriales bacterium]